MRLAVTLATQPFSKRILALAISMSFERTGVPLASIWLMVELTIEVIKSISWIIKSSTTFTSLLRGLNSIMRVDSINLGVFKTSWALIMMGLKRDRKSV